ncbi:hypothetical protein EU527_19135 [Candidatus Thorarchaeota archaeon]|nr:MAG: hypothetical protein EU527_19135 [Candidatus Thorarchaeota archaeon]
MCYERNITLVECDSCGASVNSGDSHCPYCGNQLKQKTSSIRPAHEQDSVYSFDREKGTLQFGDGKTGDRIASGRDNISASYRSGSVDQVNLVCPHCRYRHKKPTPKCEKCGTSLLRATRMKR